MKYQLYRDPMEELTTAQIIDLRDKMLKYGSWDKNWWTPARTETMDPEELIRSEGWFIADNKEEK